MAILTAFVLDVTVGGIIGGHSVLRSEITGNSYPSPEAFSRTGWRDYLGL